jgi:hypothetical protein
MRLAGAVCLLIGCSFEHGQSNGTRLDSGMSIDAPEIDGPPGCKSFSTHVDTCTQLIAGDPLTLSGANTYDTDELVLTTSNGKVTLPTRVITTSDGAIVVAFVSTLTLSAGATLRVDGNDTDRPLGIVATGAIVIEGAIDVSSNGAGARDDAQCGTSVGISGADDNGGGSGGGGGAFAGAGGNGGDGDNDTGTSNGGLGGTARARPTHILGGCDGGPGGDGSANSKAEAGDGGGAIFLASADSILISGTINAGGGGGKGGAGNGGGGGGGGSGGMIVLESPKITITGKLAANGGGGGEGADGSDGEPGNPGGLTTMRAGGGAGGAGEGGDGGSGGAVTNPSGTTATQFKKGGGGGGGGGAGFIGIGGSSLVTSGGTVISPAYQPWP